MAGLHYQERSTPHMSEASEGYREDEAHEKEGMLHVQRYSEQINRGGFTSRTRTNPGAKKPFDNSEPATKQTEKALLVIIPISSRFIISMGSGHQKPESSFG